MRARSWFDCLSGRGASQLDGAKGKRKRNQDSPAEQHARQKVDAVPHLLAQGRLRLLVSQVPREHVSVRSRGAIPPSSRRQACNETMRLPSMDDGEDDEEPAHSPDDECQRPSG